MILPIPKDTLVIIYIYIYIYIYHWRRKQGGGGGPRAPTFLMGGQWYVCAPQLLTPHFYFPLELYVYITLTNNYLAFFIYQLIILWTISINRHRWLLLNNHTSKYNSFILVLYRRYTNHVSVCPPTFWHITTPLYIHWRRKRGGGGARGACAPHFFACGGQWYVCAPPPPLNVLPHIFIFHLNYMFI